MNSILRNNRLEKLAALLMCGMVALTSPLPGADNQGDKEARIKKDIEEQKKILLIGEDKNYGGTRKPGAVIEIEELNLPCPVAKTETKYKVPDIKIKGGSFYNDGRPVYLLGAETGLLQYPALYKLLGVDVLEIGGTQCLNNILREKKDGKTVKVSLRYPKEIDYALKECVGNGFAAYIEMLEEQRNHFNMVYPLLNENFKDLFVTHGHFYLFRHDNPDAMKIRENAIKMALHAAAKYPVFAYELYNEVNFMDYGPAALERFRKDMSAKYGTIEKANAVWQTGFKDFNEIKPPVKGGGGDASFTVLGKNVSRILWLDWIKFSEANAATGFQKTYELVKKYDPLAYITIQTHASFFYDYGGGGVNPAFKSKCEDFYGDESGYTYYWQIEGRDNPVEIIAMLKSLMWIEYLSSVSDGKPQVSEETGVGGAGMSFKNLPHVVDMHNSNWKFISDNQEKGETLGYQKPDYDDSSWKNIKVPDMWANQGYKDTRFGWYRYHFSLPHGFAGKKLYLNGRELADFAMIYVNGQFTRKTRFFSEQFGIDITDYLKKGDNVIAISIKNDYSQAGRYWGGIRDGISIDQISGNGTIPLKYGQMRSFLWERAVHGESGVFPSYMYMPEGAGSSVFNPARVEFGALKGMPQAKAEINSAAEIFMTKKPRQSPVAALVYPLENMRYHIHKDFTEMISGPLITDLAKWYGGLVFSGVPSVVISNDYILEKDLNDIRVIFMRGNDRVPKGIAEKLRAYVSNGGVLVIDGQSLRTEDESNGSLDLIDMLGCEREKELEIKGSAELSALGMGACVFAARKRDSLYGTLLKLKDGKALALDNSNRPAIVENGFGKGKVYVIGSEFSEDATIKLLRAILHKEKIEPALNFAGAAEPLYTERHLFGEKGRYLLYLHKWSGGSAALSVKINKELPAGYYRVRDLETGATVADNISAADLTLKGIAVELHCQTPLSLIIEDGKLEPLTIKSLPSEQVKWLDYLDRKPLNNIPLKKRVLADSAHYNNYSRIYLLNAVKVLEDAGYEVNTALENMTEEYMKTYTGQLTTERLADYGILFMGGPRTIETTEVNKIVEWVKNGGSLFVCGNWFRGPHGWLNNQAINSKLYSKFGALVLNESFDDPVNNYDGEPAWPVFSEIDKTDLSNGVSCVVSQGMAVLDLKDPAWKALVKGGKTSKYPGRAAIAVRDFGKGKIVLCGESAWLKSPLLEQGDNKKLFLNLMEWLSEETKAKNQ